MPILLLGEKINSRYIRQRIIWLMKNQIGNLEKLTEFGTRKPSSGLMFGRGLIDNVSVSIDLDLGSHGNRIDPYLCILDGESIVKIGESGKKFQKNLSFSDLFGMRSTYMDRSGDEDATIERLWPFVVAVTRFFDMAVRGFR